MPLLLLSTSFDIFDSFFELLELSFLEISPPLLPPLLLPLLSSWRCEVLDEISFWDGLEEPDKGGEAKLAEWCKLEVAEKRVDGD